MEDLKEMFPQRMKFQMESQQKKKKKKKKIREKTTTVLPWIAKQQEALFKSLSNNQPRDSTTIFTQNAVWNTLETFSRWG